MRFANWQLSTLLRLWAFVFKRCGLPAASAACMQAVDPLAAFLPRTSSTSSSLPPSSTAPTSCPSSSPLQGPRQASSSSPPSSPMAAPLCSPQTSPTAAPSATPPSSPRPAFPSPAPSPQPSPREASPSPALAPQPSPSGYVLQVSDTMQQLYADGFLQQAPTLPAPQRAGDTSMTIPIGHEASRLTIMVTSCPPFLTLASHYKAACSNVVAVVLSVCGMGQSFGCQAASSTGKTCTVHCTATACILAAVLVLGGC